MADYSLNIIDYAFQPNSAIPLDGRAHFTNVNDANNTIRQACSVETADEPDHVNYRYYFGQIITTTNDGTYQVCSSNQFYNSYEDTLQLKYTSYAENGAQVSFEKISDSLNLCNYTTLNAKRCDASGQGTSTGEYCLLPLNKGIGYLIFPYKGYAPTGATANLNEWKSAIQYLTTCYLKPFSGGGGGGGSAQLQSDWDQTDTSAADYIKNKPTLSGKVTKAVGGIAAGTVLTDKPIEDILSDILFPYVAFTFSSITTNETSGTFEYGTTATITQVKPTFTLGSKSITSVKIGTTSGGSDLYSGSTATSGTYITLTTSTSWDGLSNKTIYCTLSDGTTTVTKSATFTQTYYTYYAVTSSTTAPTSGKKTGSTSTGDSNITTENNQYIWFLTKTAPSKKIIQQYVTGQWNDMNTTAAGTVTLTLASGKTATYYAYRTDKMVAATGRYQIV